MNEKNQSDEISLKELLQKVKEWYNYILSQWKIIVLVGIIGAALGLGYSLLQKPTYTASLSFALEDEKSGGGLGGALGLASSFGIDLGGGGGSIFTGSNLTELFKSRAMEKSFLWLKCIFKMQAGERHGIKTLNIILFSFCQRQIEKALQGFMIAFLG
jgi:hypothetical protein